MVCRRARRAVVPWASPAKRGRCEESTARCPLARTAPASSAWPQACRPVTSSSHVAASVSTTLGGVPRVWRGPSTHCTAPYGGTRTSTDRPGARCASSSSVNRTAVASVARGVAAGSARQASSACRPSGTGIRRRAGMAPMVPLTHVTPGGGNDVRP